VVVHFTALSAGVSMLPVTLLMLLLSARAGALSQRIGPRIPMSVGPVIAACALLLFSRIGAHSTYVRDILPAVVTLGLGMSLTVAPLTATALGSVDERHAGIASGVNNAVARAAGLLAVAILPLAAGLGGGSLTNSADLGPVYHRAMLICSGMLFVGAVTAFVAVPTKRPAREDESARQMCCAIAGTPLTHSHTAPEAHQ
jgi:MFS family permease